MRDRLAYLHLPKSAGTSFRDPIARCYPAELTVPWSFDRVLFGDDPGLVDVREPVFLGEPDELQGYRYMEGHWTLPVVLSAFDAADVVCILREPRARFLSHYTFWRSWPEWMHELWTPYEGARYAQRPLSEYCTDPRIAHQADNLITRLIVGRDPRIPLDAHITASDVDAVAADACARLDELGFVDVLERGDDVYTALEQWFGSPLSRERLNETKLDDGPPVDVDDFADRRTVALVNDRNAADLQLWHHVAARRGLTGTPARTTADATYAASVARVVVTTMARPVPEPPPAPPEPEPYVRPSAPVRLVRLIRRGPRVWRDRIRDEIEYRRAKR